MAKYFLGSVGKAEAFKRDPASGKMELVFVSKTLTDSGLNISTTKDDIRAGQGAPVQFSFYHDPSVEITLTDVLWKKEYLAAQLGANFEAFTKDYVTKEVSFTNGAATLTEVINKMEFPCGESYMAWGAKKGSDEWATIEVGKDGKTLTLGGAYQGMSGTFCVRYLGTVTNAKRAEITSTIIPEELYLIITAPIFAGDACSASKGKAAGHITFDVPRFVLNGSQEFSMNMSSNQTMSLAGTALASESSDCDAQGGRLLNIIEVIDNENWTDSIETLVVDEETLVKGAIPCVYGILDDGSLAKVPNSLITFTPALEANGTFGEGESGVYNLSIVAGDKTVTTKATLTA